MAEPSLTGPIPPAPGLTPPARQILDGWLDQFGLALPAPARLRRRIVDELHDGLHSAAEHHLTTGTDPIEAARSAVAEFGDPAAVATCYRDEVTAQLARRIGITLTASGPLVGLAWLAALVPPLWPPRPTDLLGAHPLYLVVLAVAIPAALFAVAATGPLSRWIPHHPTHAARAAALAATACVAGDVLLLTALAHVALSAPTALTWPTALLAATTSIARLSLASQAVHRCAGGPSRSASLH